MNGETEFILWLSGLAVFSIAIVEIIHWYNGGKTFEGWKRESKKALKEAFRSAKEGNHDD